MWVWYDWFISAFCRFSVQMFSRNTELYCFYSAVRILMLLIRQQMIDEQRNRQNLVRVQFNQDRTWRVSWMSHCWFISSRCINVFLEPEEQTTFPMNPLSPALPRCRGRGVGGEKGGGGGGEWGVWERMCGIHFLFCRSERRTSHGRVWAHRGLKHEGEGALTPGLLSLLSSTGPPHWGGGGGKERVHHGRAPAEEDVLQAERQRQIPQEDGPQTERWGNCCTHYHTSCQL